MINADWDTFRFVSDQEMQKVDMNVELNYSISEAVLETANWAVTKKEGKRRSYLGGQRSVIK